MFKKRLIKNSNPKREELFITQRRTPFWKVAIFLIPAFTIIIIFTIIPFYYTIKDGFTVNDESPLDEYPASWENFKTVWNDDMFRNSIKNSLLYTMIAVPLIIIISAIVSSCIASVIRKRLRGAFQTLFFLPYVTSAISISFAFAFIFSSAGSNTGTGLINKLLVKNGKNMINFLDGAEGHDALFPIISLGVWKGLAFNILLFTTAMLGVDKNKYKAASIDGAGPVKQFFRITIPSINKTTNFLIVMGIIGSIKVFPLALFNNDPDTAYNSNAGTLMLYVFKQIKDSNYGLGGVASVYLLLISIIFSFVLKGGLNQLVKLANYIGERNVENKIKTHRLK